MTSKYKTKQALAALAVLGGIATVLPSGASAAETYALIPKGLIDPFGAKMKDGCEAAAKEIGVTCLFVGPTSNDEGAQIQTLNDMVTRGLDGIAIAPKNPKSVARFIKKAKDSGIPVITFDSDLPEENQDLRTSFVGTDNYNFGVTLAKKVIEMKPKGGTVCIQSGTPGSINLDTRVQGVRDTLAGSDRSKPVAKLGGQNGWTEPSGCPLYNNDDITLAAQQLNDLVIAHPDLDALIAVGGWAQYAPDAYKRAMNRVKERIDSHEFVISFGDAEPPQMPLLKAGLSSFNVGQNPYQIGYKALMALHDIKAGKTVPPSIDTGFVTCTPEQADTCGK